MRPDRFQSLDILRGFAVLGILWVNIVAFGMPPSAYSIPTLIGQQDRLNLWVWASNEVFFEGTMRGLFSILFGASAMIILHSPSPAVMPSSGPIAPTRRFFRRNGILIVIGLLHAYFLLWPHDVVFLYGVIGCLLYVFRYARPLTVAILAVLLLATGTAISNDLFNPSAGITGTTIEDPMRMTKRVLERAYDRIEDEIAVFENGYVAVFRQRAPITLHQQTTELFQQHIFDIGGMMLLGAALFKWRILTAERSWRFYCFLAVVGYASALLLRGNRVYPILTDGFDVMLLMQIGELNYDIGRLPATLGHIGVIGLLCRHDLLSGTKAVLANTGRLAMTNYIAQSAIALFLFLGLGLYGTLERFQLALLCFSVWIVQLAFSTAWLSHFRAGPLEWLLTSLVNGSFQSIRKTD